MKSQVKKILAITLYCLPVIFFLVCYFLLTTSGEDIHQGAHTSVNIFGDAISAFNHSGRISDMYAWAIINLFDYQFSWGIDLIFRLLDVLMAAAIFYFIVRIALGRRPRIDIKDGAMFCLSFLLVIATQHGRVLYAGWSAIHNYLLIGLLPLIFSWLYFEKRKLPAIVMIFVGIIAGMSSNLVAIGLISSAVIFSLVYRKKVKIEKWQIAGIVGVLIGLIIMYGLGPGLNSYTENTEYITEYDYIAFSDILANPIQGVGTLLNHVILNFGRVVLPLLVVFIPTLIYILVAKIKHLKLPKWTRPEIMRGVAILTFIVTYLLALTQLRAPTRVLLPGYLAGVILAIMAISHYLKSRQVFLALGIALILLSGMIITMRLYLAIDYLKKSGNILAEIQSSSESSLCVPQEAVRSKTFPVLYLGQEDMLADWAMPELIYGKEIYFCE